MEEGTIVKWHKKIGDPILPGDLLMDVATDKATVEYQALDEGWMRLILVEEGKNAIVNQPIAVLSAEAKEIIEGYQPEGAQPLVEPEIKQPESKEGMQAEEIPQKTGAALQQPRFTPENPLEEYVFEFPTDAIEKKILASPLAKKIARDKGLDLTSVRGTGPNQRIMSRDLEKAQPLQWAYSRKREKPLTAPGTYEEIPLSAMRKVIGQRLQESKSFIPHFYVSQNIDAEPLLELREQLKKGDIKISINDLIVRASALTLRKLPHVNTGFNSVSQSIIQFKTIDIAVAVSVEAGLITPIIRHADHKSVGELASEIRYLAKKARDGKLDPKEYKGGSFTISNLGMHGITNFQAILNPPQAAILAVGGIQEIPVIRNSAIVPGKIMTLTLSVDHRVVDGVAAAVFLQNLKLLLESPVLLFL